MQPSTVRTCPATSLGAVGSVRIVGLGARSGASRSPNAEAPTVWALDLASGRGRSASPRRLLLHGLPGRVHSSLCPTQDPTASNRCVAVAVLTGESELRGRRRVRIANGWHRSERSRDLRWRRLPHRDRHTRSSTREDRWCGCLRGSSRNHACDQSDRGPPTDPLRPCSYA